MLLRLLCILTALFLSGCVSAAFTGASLLYDHNSIENQLNDYDITMHAENALNQDPSLVDLHSYGVTTFKRVILVTGRVTNATEYQHIDKIIRQTAGAVKVFNAVEIGPPLSALTATKDSWITTKIKAQIIAAHGINPEQIKVVTEGGVVYLMGTVSNPQKTLVTNIAKKTAGVKKIVEIFNYITTA